ncbi:lytic transglycosylase domain-containing protein [Sulfurovum mangrovi]|uniref:lytic transglycosylase domain-containing protein n=1 Tax=Sulfurovum mangrovi TaxID=2893889 RepID=UPI001E5D45A4|nr:lytic transglycosylase domain-containing protein [Sulfurovum mangrovi]UFH60509.1 transglycosylase SLT domain-containing protein [Sulfurovum mangrovi]
MRSAASFIISLWLATLSLYGISVPQKYPSYAYVLSEFDIDESYAYNREFENYIEEHGTQFSALYRRSLQRGEFLLPMVQKQLIEAELSDLLAYLPMIESGYLTDIESPKKAKGLWQFMPSTAKEYNLTVSYSRDERCDPVNATTAAVFHLQRLYRKFGKGYLALMAYNCGEGRLSQAIREAGSDDLAILIDDRAKYLPGETREYIRRILLIAMIGESEVIDFGPVKEVQTKGIVQVEVKGDTNLKEIASLLSMEPATLLRLNSQYQERILPDTSKQYKITIPYEKMILFYLNYPPAEEEVKTPKDHFVSHIVSRGETLKIIADDYHATVSEIKRVNHLQNADVEEGRLLIIPVTEAKFESVAHQR